MSRSPGRHFTLDTLDLDEPRPDEVLVQLVATGVCHTDLTFAAQLPGPAVLGHEGAGVVAAVGADVSGVAPGDHVVLSFRSCRSCRHCRTGYPSYCSRGPLLNMSGRRVDGSATLTDNDAPVHGSFFGQSSFAQYALAAPDNVVVVDPAVDLTVAAPLGCGFQTGAGAVMNVLAPEPDARLVVFGAGGVGLAAIMAAKALGVDSIVAVDPVESRRAKALQLGAKGAVDPTAVDVSEAVRGATHALDTTGVPAVVSTALRALTSRGALVVVGLGAQEGTIDLQDLMLSGKTLRGCTEGDAVPQKFVPELLSLHAAGRFPIDTLVTRYDFADINRAVADMKSGVTIKPVLIW